MASSAENRKINYYTTGSAEGRGINNHIRDVIMPDLESQLGIDALPMRRPDFDFFEGAKNQLWQLGFRGQDLDHTTLEVMQILVFNIGEAEQIPIYDYVRQYKNGVAQGFNPPPFDTYFLKTCKRKGLTALKKENRRKRDRGPSIGRGMYYDEEGEIAPDFLGDTGARSPSEAFVEKKELLAKVYEMLLKDVNHGRKHALVWKLMRKGFNFREIAEAMNKRKIPTPGGKDVWGTSTVEKVRNSILGMIKRALGERGIDWESMVASRKRGFRFGAEAVLKRQVEVS